MKVSVEAQRYVAQLREASAFVLDQVGKVPNVMVTLGSGLEGVAENLTQQIRLPFEKIPHFPQASVAGHPGTLVIGNSGRNLVAVFQGRVHIYEGHAPFLVVFGLRMLGLAGTKQVILTNSAGGINPDLKVGDLMLIDNHVGLFCPDPTEGVYHPDLGPLFYDMFTPYDYGLQTKAERTAADLGLELKRGVYAYYRQSSYETKAEIEALRRMGADAVGKSTVPEVLAARQMGLSVLGISCISSSMAVDKPAKPLTHEEVLLEGRRASSRFQRLVCGVLEVL